MMQQMVGKQNEESPIPWDALQYLTGIYLPYSPDDCLIDLFNLSGMLTE